MLIPPDARRPTSRQVLATVPAHFRHSMLRLMPFGPHAPSAFKDLQALAYWAVAKHSTLKRRADAMEMMCSLYEHHPVDIPRRWQLIEEIAQYLWRAHRCFRIAEICFKARVDLADGHIDEEPPAGIAVGIPTIRGSKSKGGLDTRTLDAGLDILSEAISEMSAKSSAELARLPEQDRMAAIRILRLYSVEGLHRLSSSEQPVARLRFFRSTGRSLWRALTKVPLVHAKEPHLYGEAAMNRIDHALWGGVDQPEVSSEAARNDAMAGEVVQRPGHTAGGDARDASPPTNPSSSLMHVVIKGTLNVPNDNDERAVLKQYEVLRKPLPLAALPLLEKISIMQAELSEEFPWAADAIDAVFAQLRARRQFGSVRLAFTPLLLCGPPGTGKTRLARRFGEVLKLETLVMKLGGATDAMSILGTSRGWSSGQPSPLLRPLLKGTATALIILDEIDKPANDTKNSPPVESALLSLLEQEDARRWRDNYLQTECDLSGLLYIATCNATTWIPNALKSRFRIIDVRRPTLQELRNVARFVARDLETEWGLEAGALQGVPFEQLLPSRMYSLRQLRSAMASAIGKWLDAPAQDVKH